MKSLKKWLLKPLRQRKARIGTSSSKRAENFDMLDVPQYTFLMRMGVVGRFRQKRLINDPSTKFYLVLKLNQVFDDATTYTPKVHLENVGLVKPLEDNALIKQVYKNCLLNNYIYDLDGEDVIFVTKDFTDGYDMIYE